MTAILATVDFSENTEAVVKAAIRESSAMGAKLYLIHVAEPEPGFVTYDPGPKEVRDAVAAELRADHRQIQELVEKNQEEGIQIEPLLIQGAAAEKILEEVDKLEASLIVIGSHGHGRLYNLIVGSVAEAVIRGSKVPVLVVPSPEKS